MNSKIDGQDSLEIYIDLGITMQRFAIDGQVSSKCFTCAIHEIHVMSFNATLASMLMFRHE